MKSLWTSYIRSDQIIQAGVYGERQGNHHKPGYHKAKSCTSWPNGHGRLATLHYGRVPRIDASQWVFRIFGLVEKERSLSLDEFNALPIVKVFSDIHCVTTWSRLDNLWEGVSTSVLKELAKINHEAGFAIIHASGGFTTNLSLEDFFQEDVLFVIKHDGKIITPDHGYPVRLVVPRLYFWKSNLILPEHHNATCT